MDPADIGWTGLAASLVLVAVAVALSAWQRLHQTPSILWACARALVQLVLVGAGLLLVFEGPLWLSAVWVVLIVLYAGVTVWRRAPEVPRMLTLSLVAMTTAAVVTLGVIFGLGIFPLEPRALVPLAGLMLGNSMSNTVLAARRVVEEVRDHRDEVEARLALGQSSTHAARPFVRRAIRAALIPQLESTKAVGVVALPGTMTGLILAGASPTQAVLVQVAIMYLILGAVATTATTVALGVAQRLFTHDHRLLPLPRPSEG